MGSYMSRLGVLLLVLWTSGAFAGDTELGGNSDKQVFLLFDKELRKALSQQDVATMALLVDFPLRVNYSDGSSISLNNEAALQTRFAEIFPTAVRSAVLKQKPEKVSCDYLGSCMYGHGVVWIKAIEQQGMTERYRLTVINLRAVEAQRSSPKTWGLEYVCDCEKHRIVIDSDASEKVRYRAWNKPRFITDKPDMELASGTTSFEGTAPCTHPIWTFKKGNTEFVVSKHGCTGGSEPEGSKGSLEVSVGGELKQNWWCW